MDSYFRLCASMSYDLVAITRRQFCTSSLKSSSSLFASRVPVSYVHHFHSLVFHICIFVKEESFFITIVPFIVFFLLLLLYNVCSILLRSIISKSFLLFCYCYRSQRFVLHKVQKNKLKIVQQSPHNSSSSILYCSFSQCSVKIQIMVVILCFAQSKNVLQLPSGSTNMLILL